MLFFQFIKASGVPCLKRMRSTWDDDVRLDVEGWSWVQQLFVDRMCSEAIGLVEKKKNRVACLVR